MSDTPEGTPTPDDGTIGDAAAAEDKAWHQNPMVWGVAALAAILAVVIIAVAVSSSDDETAATDAITSTTAPSSSTTVSNSTTGPAGSTTAAPTTSAAPETTAAPTTSAAPETTATAGPEAVVIEASPVSADVLRYAGTDADFPFVDGDVEANWYTWNDHYVVVYAGWDATSGEPFCPGNSVNIGGAFDFISNSPTTEGSCDPEDVFPNLVDDADFGARVCDTLVLYRTIIPIDDDAGAPIAGQLYGTIERYADGAFVGATGVADIAAVVELDPTADAYAVPDGWLPDGATEVVC